MAIDLQALVATKLRLLSVCAIFKSFIYMQRYGVCHSLRKARCVCCTEGQSIHEQSKLRPAIDAVAKVIVHSPLIGHEH